MKKHIFCIILTSLSSLASCAPSVSSRIASIENYDYNFDSSESGFACSTGPVQAENLHDRCTNLLDDSLNNYCARGERMEMFRQENCQQIIGIAGM
jgi:hypothetical protein